MTEHYEVVSPDAEQTRTAKSTSFDLTSQYDVDLLNHAVDEINRKYKYYSVYIKRLIERDMENKQGFKHSAPVTTAVEAESIIAFEEIEDNGDSFF